MCAGILYIISTPIGNMGDITLRALDVIKDVDYILSEDTRETYKLLSHYEVDKSQMSYRDQNHQKILSDITDLLDSGKSLALISDSGTPLISDPGFKLVRDILTRNYEIKVVPGASALISALVISGLPTDNFIFLGFLPKSKLKIKNMLIEYGNHDATLIIYESPYRIIKLVEEVMEVLGERYIAIARELTKIHEEVIRGEVTEVLDLLSKRKIKGEMVLLIAKKGYKP